MTNPSIYLLTYNCARELLDPQALAKHILQVHNPQEQAPELLVVALQEIAPLRPSFLGGNWLNAYWKSWHDALDIMGTMLQSSTNGIRPEYKLIAKHSVGMMALAVYGREPERVQWLKYAGVGCGFWEMGNKGAVGIKLGYKTSSSTIPADRDDTELKLAFACAHLAPHEHMLEKRNEDWETIVRGLAFTPKQWKTQPNVETADQQSLLTQTTPEMHNVDNLYAADTHVFVLGDLNYRTARMRPAKLDYEAFPQPTKSNTMNDKTQVLFEQDQLQAEMAAGRTLTGFQEAKINFQPTYKYKLNKSDVDTHEEFVPTRWPSWCDRILWMHTGQDGKEVQVHRYSSIPELNLSDHKPVALSVSLVDAVQSTTQAITTSPFPLDSGWESKRASARRKEVAVGIFLTLFDTWAGYGVLFTFVITAYSLSMILQTPK